MVWECTYEDQWGIETTKSCYTSCCEHDCCGSSTTSAGLILGITLPVSLLLFFLLVCCRIWARRRALTRQTIVTVPTRGVIVTRTNVTRTGGAGAPVPQHQGYDQPGFQPSTMPMAAQYQPPPPYMEQPPKATETEEKGVNL